MSDISAIDASVSTGLSPHYSNKSLSLQPSAPPLKLSPGLGLYAWRPPGATGRSNENPEQRARDSRHYGLTFYHMLRVPFDCVIAKNKELWLIPFMKVSCYYLDADTTTNAAIISGPIKTPATAAHHGPRRRSWAWSGKFS